MALSTEELTLKFDIYEGPLDLLLHLIKRNEVDIYDIPISLITSQYIEYMNIISEINLDLVGDFLIMAATLTHIKSKMLLPSNTEANSGDQPAEDPRLELVRPLLEYAAFQEATLHLAERPILDRDVFTRGGDGLGTLDLDPEQKMEAQGKLLDKLSAYELVKAWRDLVDRAQGELTLNFIMETVTIGQKIGQIKSFLIEVKSAHFQELLNNRADNLDLSLCFIAILELARTGFLRLWQDHELDPTGPRLFLADPGAAVDIKALDDYS